MSEQNKALVREILNEIDNGNLAVLEDHPGMHETIPFLTALQQAAELHSREIQEQLADGDWVITRSISEITLKVDAMGTPAGTDMVVETIAMYKVVDGIIVKQHAQGNRIDVTNPWD